jgi:adenylosuccinate synthase
MQYDVEAEIVRYNELAELLKPFITDTIVYLNEAYESGKRILVEGANATMLDLDFGTYPFVTSSNPSVGGIATGLGLAPNKYEALIGVVSVVLMKGGGVEERGCFLCPFCNPSRTQVKPPARSPGSPLPDLT